jgi:hypothetical protein
MDWNLEAKCREEPNLKQAGQEWFVANETMKRISIFHFSFFISLLSQRFVSH